jgi:hypothetical protein
VLAQDGQIIAVIELILVHGRAILTQGEPIPRAFSASNAILEKVGGKTGDSWDVPLPSPEAAAGRRKSFHSLIHLLGGTG